MRTSALLFLPALTAAAATPACNANNCLRAVRASSFPTRSGLADCLSYFQVTVTPATSTVTVTSTAPPTTLTDSETTTVTVPVTVASTQDEILTVSTTSTSYTGTTTVTVDGPVNNKAKRQATVVPSDIPSYASACSGAPGYSSACSCVGATASTVTAPTPITTTTVVASSTATATAVQTSTAFTTVSTASTTSFTDTQTATTVIAAAATDDVSPQFVLQPIGQGFTDANYIGLTAVDPSYPYLFVTTAPWQFYIDYSAGGFLVIDYYGLPLMTGPPETGTTFLFFVQDPTFVTVSKCVVGADSILSCDFGWPSCQADSNLQLECDEEPDAGLQFRVVYV